MARLPRLDLPGIPQHIVQRGNNRFPCFLDDDDRRRYLQLLRQATLKTKCHVHAYVLMDNHVHLLATPPEAGAVSRMMQALGRGYVGLFNARHGRAGTLWEGRYKSCLVDNLGYVLACYRCIELNPVRARTVESPDRFPWSSHAFNALGQPDALLTPHPCYLGLGGTLEPRTEAYRAIVSEVLAQSTINEIRLYLQQQRAWPGCLPEHGRSKDPALCWGAGRSSAPQATARYREVNLTPFFRTPFFPFCIGWAGNL